MIVGTKSDLENQRSILRGELDDLSKIHHIPAYEISSLTGSNVQECFSNFLQNVYEDIKKVKKEIQKLQDETLALLHSQI